MWKNRTFYMGCSVGIWFSCLLVAVLLPIQQTSGQVSGLGQTMTPSEQLRSQAEKQHLVVLTQQEFAEQQAQVNKLNVQIKAMQQSAANKQTQTGNRNVNIVYVAIQPGLTLSEIGDLLNKAGVVGDANSFVQAADQVHSFIKAGVYAFPMHADNTTVLNMITK